MHFRVQGALCSTSHPSAGIAGDHEAAMACRARTRWLAALSEILPSSLALGFPLIHPRTTALHKPYSHQPVGTISHSELSMLYNLRVFLNTNHTDAARSADVYMHTVLAMPRQCAGSSACCGVVMSGSSTWSGIPQSSCLLTGCHQALPIDSSSSIHAKHVFTGSTHCTGMRRHLLELRVAVFQHRAAALQHGGLWADMRAHLRAARPRVVVRV